MSIIKKKNKDNKKYLAIMNIAAIIMIASVIIIMMIIKPKEQSNDNTSYIEPETDEEREELEKEEIESTQSETKRMKRYIGIFFEDIEEERYQDAYNVLNQDFKNNYFPTLEDFTQYAKKYLDSSTLGITYDNIERLGNDKTGNMYVVWTTLTDIFRPKLEDDEELDQTTFVIIEYDYNDYEMSFRVNSVEE